jgi:hypothetical protein
MSYFFVEEMVASSALSNDLMRLTIFGMPRLALASLFPSMIGVVSVILGSGLIFAILQRVAHSPEGGWEKVFEGNIRILFRCFYALSAVLVTSTAAALLFYKLPVGLVPPDGDTAGLASALSAFASSAGTFWGGCIRLRCFRFFSVRSPLCLPGRNAMSTN